MVTENEKVEKFKVTGMSCAACSARVERAVGAVSGVASCSVNLLTGDMSVTGRAGRDDIVAAVKKAGYGIDGESNASAKGKEKTDRSEIRSVLLRLIVSGVILLPLMYFAMGHMLGAPIPPLLEGNPVAVALIQMLLSLSVMIINQKFFINGAKGVVKLAPNMDTLVSLGSFVSFGYSVYILFEMSGRMTAGDLAGAKELLHGLYFESAAMILVLITLGKLLEARAKGKTADSIRALMSLTPPEAIILVDEKETRVAVKDIKVGDLFVLRPGDRVPVDGVIVRGFSAFDESALSGESIPKDKGVGDSIYASAINTHGYIVARAEKVGEGTFLAEIIRTVKEAQTTKAPIARLADKVSGIFVPVVLGIALVTLCAWLIAGGDGGYAVSRAITVLVISCPCALGLATPVAIMVGSGVGARHGILYKNAAALEMGGRIKVVALDKTGTVTEGSPRVTDVIPAQGVSEDELLYVAMTLEGQSEHPLSLAVVALAKERGTRVGKITDFYVTPGCGVWGTVDGKRCIGANYNTAKNEGAIDEKAEEIYLALAGDGKTPMFFISDGSLLGIIAVADRIRDGAAEAVATLRKMGIRTVMLTGDSRPAAELIASAVGIDDVRAELLPTDKADAVRSLSSFGRVCMVGDGINDAPALSVADLGMAIGVGADIAIDSADVVLVGSSPMEIPAALKLGRRTLLNIKENLFWAFLYNCIGIPLAAGVFGFGFSPMIGAAAMSLSSVSVVLNALRLGLFKPTRHPTSTAKSEPRENRSETENNNKEICEMTKVFKVEGMMCPHCEARVKAVVEEISGVISAIPDHTNSIVTVTLEGDADKAVIDAIEKAGYKVIL